MGQTDREARARATTARAVDEPHGFRGIIVRCRRRPISRLRPVDAVQQELVRCVEVTSAAGPAAGTVEHAVVGLEPRDLFGDVLVGEQGEAVVANVTLERDVVGRITKAGDLGLRRALCQAATVMLHRGRGSWLRTWASKVQKRRGAKRAMVALARRIGVVLHRMWRDGTCFQSEEAPRAA
jgi:transposase